MENKINIGIVGNGFVGSAIAHGFSLWAKLRIYDKNQKLSTHSLKDVVQKSEIVFVCVPTPMDTSDANKIDLSILDSVMADIHNYNDNYDGKNTVIVIKSTVIPGTTKKYEKMYTEHVNYIYKIINEVFSKHTDSALREKCIQNGTYSKFLDRLG